jgi:hypothetical protein
MMCTTFVPCLRAKLAVAWFFVLCGYPHRTNYADATAMWGPGRRVVCSPREQPRALRLGPGRDDDGGSVMPASFGVDHRLASRVRSGLAWGCMVA